MNSIKFDDETNLVKIGTHEVIIATKDQDQAENFKIDIFISSLQPNIYLILLHFFPALEFLSRRNARKR